MNTQSITLSKKIICILLTLALAVTFVPTLSLSARADDNTAATKTQKADIDIDAMLNAGSYTEGEAIAVVRADLTSNNNANQEAESLLNHGETLMDASTDTTKEALNVEIPNANAAAKSDSSLNAVNTSTDEAVKIVLVKDPNKSTREIIEELMNNARVISAEPSYTYQVTDIEKDTPQESNLEDSTQLLSNNTSSSTATAQDTLVTTDTRANINTPSCVTEDGGLTKTENGYDMSSWQWGYTKTNAFKRSNDTSTPIDGTGIANWNNPDNKNADGTVVAVMDSGLDYTNPDIKGATLDENNAAISKACGGGEYGLNGMDDGKDKSEVQDNNGHGTHCAGIIAANWNGYGTSGAANGAQILPIRCGTGDNLTIYASAVIKGYDYISKCIDKGMNVVAANNSWGTDFICRYALNLAITKVGKKGCVSIFSSANSNLDNDTHTAIPNIGAENPYLIVVNATRHTDTKADYSNYGQVTTNIFAAGSEIVSTYAHTNKKVSYGPADTDPAYRNYFTNQDINKHLIVSDITFDSDGNRIFPTSYKDLVNKPSTNASFASSSSVDSAEGSGSLNLKATNANKGEFWIGIPVAASDINKIESMSAHGYSISSGNTGGIIMAPTLTNGTAAEITERTIPNALLELSSHGEWMQGNVTTENIINSTPAPTTGKWQYNFLDTDNENVKLLICVGKIVNTTDEGGYIDAITLHKTGADNGNAAKWTLLEGTSMAAPAVSGCAAIYVNHSLKFATCLNSASGQV